jgi:hypothetical protein
MKLTAGERRMNGERRVNRGAPYEGESRMKGCPA